MLEIIVNGKTISLAKPSSLSDVLTSLDLPKKRIAVELNRVVIRRGEWDDILVNEQDRLEIIHFVGGG